MATAPESQRAPVREHTFVFIGGLHRSGTTLLARCLAAHQEASGFSETGAIEDEGQFLQPVYPIAGRYGGPGRFGFAPEMHMTENAAAVTDVNRRALLAAWSRYWDRERTVLIEKSPPNLLKTRFLQAMFPNSRFVIVLRHPIANAFATQKWSGTHLHSLIRHWLVCNEIMLADARRLRYITLLRYEDLVAKGDEELMRLHRFMGLEPAHYGLEPREGLNEAYFSRWEGLGRSPWGAAYRELIVRRFEARVRRFGYSLRDPRLMDGRQAMLKRLIASEPS